MNAQYNGSILAKITLPINPYKTKLIIQMDMIITF